MEIGIALIEHNETGTSKSWSFTPTMVIEGSITTVNSITPAREIKDIEKEADIAFASFFSKLTEIELADREEYQIKSEVVECLKWPNGNIKLCKLKYYYLKI